jgi:hypothetical protein
MKRYRCDDCDNECRLEIGDDASIPDTCVLTGNSINWIYSIVIQTPENKQLKDAEVKIEKLQEALVGLIGTDKKDEMENMVTVLEAVPGEMSIVTTRAIKALIETKWPDSKPDNVDKINDDPEDWK